MGSPEPPWFRVQLKKQAKAVGVIYTYDVTYCSCLRVERNKENKEPRTTSLLVISVIITVRPYLRLKEKDGRGY